MSKQNSVDLKTMFVTNSRSGGGAERAINLVADSLSGYFDVQLTTINGGPSDFVKPSCAQFNLDRDKEKGLLEIARSIRDFRRVLRMVKPDFLILNCALPEFMAAVSWRRLKLIVVEHVQFPYKSRELLGIVIRLVLFLRGARFVSVSSHLKIWPLRKKPRFVIENPISVQQSVKSNYSPGKKIKGLLFVGRLVNPQKQPDLVLRVANETGLPVKLMGTGALEEQLFELAGQLHLKADFYGQQLNPWNLIEEGDVLIVPSLYEGDGLVVVEALLNGVPILVRDTPDFRRFGFEPRHYCRDINDFVRQLKLNEDDIKRLVVDKPLVDLIVKEREIKGVVEKWQTLLNLYDRVL